MLRGTLLIVPLLFKMTPGSLIESFAYALRIAAPTKPTLVLRMASVYTLRSCETKSIEGIES